MDPGYACGQIDPGVADARSKMKAGSAAWPPKTRKAMGLLDACKPEPAIGLRAMGRMGAPANRSRLEAQKSATVKQDQMPTMHLVYVTEKTPFLFGKKVWVWIANGIEHFQPGLDVGW